MIRRIIGLSATTALAVLAGATPADAGTTTASCRGSVASVSATTYADRLVRAWGRGDTATTNCYASTATSRTLFGQATPGGIHWRRVSTEGAAGTIYVTYHDDARGGTLTITGREPTGTRLAWSVPLP